ncbi:MAG: T9SS type A sorting domain-containing protein [Sphingobacteriia bacterium]|nr:T9SS type A sorting domain-containing protein [Sphingobacteriia bacterium]
MPNNEYFPNISYGSFVKELKNRNFMKKVSLHFRCLVMVLMVLLSIQNLRSQELVSSHAFVHQGSEWYYNYNNFWIEGYVKIGYIGDTIISGQTTHILKKDLFYYDFIREEYEEIDLGAEYICSNDDSVFIYRHNRFYLLFDFSALPGDTWTVPETFETDCDTTGVVVVVSAGYTLINGKTYRYIDLQGESNSDWAITGRVVERIGTIENYLLPNPELCVIDLFEGGPLRCYADDEIGLISTGISVECDYLADIVVLDKEFSAKLYPNPSTTELWLQLPENILPEQAQIELFNPTGKLLYKVQPASRFHSIEIAHLPTGLYLMRLWDGERWRTEKVVIK